ncbi:MAG: sigma-70 family RNA polymerase sigma factor [Planctomycetes bacterium]|nr:sigma-70 family RNA polymerase sigma factor [Planctomycetota bacterium]
MTPGPDDALLAGLAAGDEGAFAALYDRYGAALFRVAHALLGSREEAEDAVQDVFLDLVRSRASLARVRDLRAYVFASLRHAAARRRRRPFPATADLDGISSGGEAAPSVDERGRLARAMRALPPSQREVLALHIEGEMTFAEIGAALGISINTAASRYRYALEKLRAALEGGSR